MARAVLIVAALNLAHFGVEFAMAVRIELASLLADAADNLLIFIGLG
ncbi:hypothetical protein [Caulobacter sp. RHG1]|nr:hypothetical protein [Caulobacter sp. RHG1]NQE64311.1 hypothetical protein [Caulobacter sp. RHG1]